MLRTSLSAGAAGHPALRNRRAGPCLLTHKAALKSPCTERNEKITLSELSSQREAGLVNAAAEAAPLGKLGAGSFHRARILRMTAALVHVRAFGESSQQRSSGQTMSEN